MLINALLGNGSVNTLPCRWCHVTVGSDHVRTRTPIIIFCKGDEQYLFAPCHSDDISLPDEMHVHSTTTMLVLTSTYQLISTITERSCQLACKYGEGGEPHFKQLNVGYIIQIMFVHCKPPQQQLEQYQTDHHNLWSSQGIFGDIQVNRDMWEISESANKLSLIAAHIHIRLVLFNYGVFSCVGYVVSQRRMIMNNVAYIYCRSVS